VRDPHHPSCDELDLSAVLHALSDPARLAIVRELGSGTECSCGGFDVGLSKPTLSHHLRVLREAGVTQTRCDGRHRLVSLRRDDLEARFPGLLDAIASADRDTAAARGRQGARLPTPTGGSRAAVPPARFELASRGLKGRRSRPLSYGGD
jgi:DNA-binding transcriptional ArsR family regulator